MSNIEVNQIINGKVTGIQPYGAFVTINDDTQGLVHISEVTHGFVKDIHEHLSVGDEVKAKVLNIDESKNKVSLSIRATEEAPKKEEPVSTRNQKEQKDDNAGFNTLKGKLEEWMKQSKERESTFKN